MSSVFLGSDGDGLTAAQLQDGTFVMNVARITNQGLAPGLPVCTNANKQLVSRLITPADFNGAFLTNPLNATLSCLDVSTAYNTVPRSLNGVVTAFDAFTAANLGAGGGEIFVSKVGTGTPAPTLGMRSIRGVLGANVSTDVLADEVVVSGAYSVSNVGGGGTALYRGSTTDGINVANSFATLTTDGTGVSISGGDLITLGSDIAGSSLGAGAGVVYSGKVGASLLFRGIAAGSGISVSQNASDITIATAATTAPTLTAAPLATDGVSGVWQPTAPASATSMVTSMQPQRDRYILSGAVTGFRYSDDGCQTATVSFGGALRNYVTCYDGITAAYARSFTGAGEAWVSLDGVTWAVVTALPTLAQVNSKALACSAGILVCCVVNGGLGIETSSDGGLTWVPRATARPPQWVLALGSGRFVAGGSAGFSYSTDSGATWVNGGGLSGALLSNTAAYEPVQNLILAPQANINKNLIRSDDLGATWFARPGSNPSALDLTAAAWVSEVGRFIFLGSNGVDGRPQALTTTGGYPTLSPTSSSYLLCRQTTLIGGVVVASMVWDTIRQRLIYGTPDALAGTYYSTGINAIATRGGIGGITGVADALLGGASQARAAYLTRTTGGVLDYPQTAGVQLRSGAVTTGDYLSARINTIGYPLCGPTVKRTARFDATLAGQTLYASDGVLSFGWSAVFRQLTLTTVAANFYGVNTFAVHAQIQYGIGSQWVGYCATSPILAAATTYFVVGAGLARIATFDNTQASPARTDLTIVAGSSVVSGSPSYNVTIMASAGGGSANITIRREFADV